MAELGLFELHVRGNAGQVFRLEMTTSDGYVVGRSDPVNSQYIPDVDLKDCDAAEHGVSRRHAAIVTLNDEICLVDLNSSNGTFVNGQKLRPDYPQVLQDEDKLRFGTLYALVSFVPNLQPPKIKDSHN